MIWICANKKCKTHHEFSSGYQHSPEEKARRKKEKEERIAAEKARLANQTKFVTATLKDISIPLNSSSINILLGIVLERIGNYDLQEFVESKGWEPEKIKASWGREMIDDYVGTCIREAKKENPAGVLRFIFEVSLFGLEVEAIKKITKAMN